MHNHHIPTLGFVAWSGMGKTTLLIRLIPLLRERGLRVGVIKHSHHDFEIDTPGKDSYEMRKAGANPVLVGSRQRWALMKETPNQEEPILTDLLSRFERDRPDLILIEGLRHERFPKIEVYRPSMGKPLLYPENPSVIAIATDNVISGTIPIPILDLNRPDRIATFILDTLGKDIGNDRAIAKR